MSRYLERKYGHLAEKMKAKKVLELGSGCGLSGITAALLGATVTFTDTAKLLPWLKKNVSCNLTQQEYFVTELDWTKYHRKSSNKKDLQLDKNLEDIDIILGTDLVYHSKLVIPLLKTAHSISSSKTIFILGFEIHDRSASNLFWKHVETFFEVTKVEALV